MLISVNRLCVFIISRTRDMIICRKQYTNYGIKTMAWIIVIIMHIVDHNAFDIFRKYAFPKLCFKYYREYKSSYNIQI